MLVENEDKNLLIYFRHLLCQHLLAPEGSAIPLQLPKKTGLLEHNLFSSGREVLK